VPAWLLLIKGYGYEKGSCPRRPGYLPSSSWRRNRDDYLSATGRVRLRRLKLLTAQGGRCEGVFRALGRHDYYGGCCDCGNGSPEIGGR
jgi:hypothetical protein